MSEENSINEDEQVQFYQKFIKNGSLEIEGDGEDDELKNIEFLELLNIHQLEFNSCANIIPKFKNDALKKLIIRDSTMQTLNQLQLQNLEELQLILEEYHCQYSIKVNIQSLKLKFLNIQAYNHVDVGSLKNLTQLTTVYLIYCQLNDIDVLCYLVNLKELHMDSSQLLYIYPLEELKQLEILTITNNKITDLSPIQNHLKYSKYKITDQYQPSENERTLANKLKYIYQSASLLRKLNNKNTYIGKQQDQTKKIVETHLRQQQYDTGSFISKVTQLFQILGQFEGYQ
ncbi:leucine-rich_repeat domain-containing protein [Hexamita inflata]|uniref:Leucine-rich repeat domain-containing protein n=1 Tax=Hexamita inflata TaxID=28002 RepID=A0AA86TNK6_9EUKA|nr:leucine-rich repeat domain-containing protein [Hexamita inflata]